MLACHGLSPHSETDITSAFEAEIRGSNPLEGIGDGRRVGNTDRVIIFSRDNLK